MAKEITQLTVCRKGLNETATARIVTVDGLIYFFDVAPELTDRRILALVGTLVAFEERGDQQNRRRRRY